MFCARESKLAFMAESFNFPTVNLTVVNSESGLVAGVIAMKVSKLLSYKQHHGFTRLRLTGGAHLDVRECTGEIDRRLRKASSQENTPILSSAALPTGFSAKSPKAGCDRNT